MPPLPSSRPSLLSVALIPTVLGGLLATQVEPSASAASPGPACELVPEHVDLPGCTDPSLQNLPSATDLACELEADLFDLIDCIENAAPYRATELYVFPTPQEAGDFGSVAAAMMLDAEDGVLSCDIPLPPSLENNYRLSSFDSNGRSFCVLHEFLDADVDGYSDLGWGTFIVAGDAHNELNLQASHLRADLYTEKEVVDLFERTYSRSVLVNGSHREANSALSICQGHLDRSNGEPYLEADAAHGIDTFYAAAKAVANHYGAVEVGGVVDLSAVHPDYHALQFHGMGSGSCGDLHVFVTNGEDTPVQPTDGAGRLAAALRFENPGWNVGYPGDGTTVCNLKGSRNTFGRFLNGVEDSGGNDYDNPICHYDGDLPSVQGRFIHIEQKRCLSGTSCSYGDPDAVRTAAYWENAINAAFAPPACDDGIANGDEAGVDCGGSCPNACGPTCDDGIANGDEEGVDCGGSCPSACPTCNDGIANGDEEGIDCGGSCPDACAAPICVPSGEGQACTDSTPCCSGTGNCTKGKPNQRVCQ